MEDQPPKDFDAAKMTRLENLEALKALTRKPAKGERKKKAKIFEKESDLCAAFIGSLPDEWQAYPESCGFDILLVRKADGFQIGVEAKLALNGKVICQVAEKAGTWEVCRPAPDCRAVLVPDDASGDLAGVCRLLGISVIRQYAPTGTKGQKYKKDYYWVEAFTPRLPEVNTRQYSWDEDWFERCPQERCEVPDYVPDVVAGVKCPVQLTPWKVSAIKLVVTLDKRGYLTRRDFKHHQVSMSRWTQGGWLFSQGDGRWTKGQYMPDLRGQHPVNYVEIEKDYEIWKLPDTILQGALGDKKGNKAADL